MAHPGQRVRIRKAPWEEAKDAYQEAFENWDLERMDGLWQVYANVIWDQRDEIGPELGPMLDASEEKIWPWFADKIDERGDTERTVILSYLTALAKWDRNRSDMRYGR